MKADNELHSNHGSHLSQMDNPVRDISGLILGRQITHYFGGIYCNPSIKEVAEGMSRILERLKFRRINHRFTNFHFDYVEFNGEYHKTAEDYKLLENPFETFIEDVRGAKKVRVGIAKEKEQAYDSDGASFDEEVQGAVETGEHFNELFEQSGVEVKVIETNKFNYYASIRSYYTSFEYFAVNFTMVDGDYSTILKHKMGLKTASMGLYLSIVSRDGRNVRPLFQELSDLARSR
ncbi:hypothetical protein HY636_05505 [Candidatus Woesearchaeota archaeon]|nr:hypothetical protein [Candidatus Woesearchaeota archaeon]